MNLKEHPNMLQWLLYIIGLRSKKLNLLEWMAYYCAVLLHTDVLMLMLWFGSLAKSWPQLIKEHAGSDPEEESEIDAQFYLHGATLHAGPDRPINVGIQLTWLSKYTDLDFSLFKKWMQDTYGQGVYNKLTINCQILGVDKRERVIIVDLEKAVWHITGITEETDIMFDAFPLFTVQQ